MDNFDGLSLQPALLHALAAMNFKTPTPIQAAAIPPALEGLDILGTAQTGTGKTGAFGIPLIAHLLNNPDDHALVMTPTRELATQVMATMHQLIGKKTRINSALLIGGASMMNQFEQLRKSPRLIVGTPGRITDHLLRKSVSLSSTRFLVLDETDRMLDMGFGIQIDRILSFIPKERQTLLFSATLPKNILKLSGQYLTNPVRISTGSTNAPAALVKQEKIDVSESEKYSLLLKELEKREGTIIVFVKTKSRADRLAKKLRTQNHSADAIHGDLRQNQRDRAIKAFKNYETRILVATDIAARGLDIPHIETVINYDLPQVAEDYIHRIGRTARNGAEGVAVSLVTHEDGKKWHAIHRLLNPHEKSERAPGKPGFTKSKSRSRDRDYGRPARSRKNADPFEKSAQPRPHEKRESVKETYDPINAPAKKQFAGKRRFDRNDSAPSSFRQDAPRPARKAFSFDDRKPSSFEGQPSRAKKDRFNDQRAPQRNDHRDAPTQERDGSRNFKPKTGKKPFGAKARPPRAGDVPSSTGKPYRAHKAKSFGGKNSGNRRPNGLKASA
ncbi:MAG: DEAD/DEAH box helicase [Hyphomicrobiales bacterium]